VEEYIQEVIQNLTLDDLKLINALYNKDATTKFKSVTNKYATKESTLSASKYRKSLDRLTGNCFVEHVIGGKEHRVFVTTYGMYALEKTLEGVEVN